MTLFYKQKELMVLIFIAPILFNCSGKSEATTSGPFTSKSHSKTVKPGAPVKLVSESLISVNPGQQTSITIELETDRLNGYLDLHFVPSQGLDVLNTDAHQMVNLSNTQTIKIPVTLLAQTDGRYYLNMHINMESDELRSSRTLALIVQVGAETAEEIKLQKTSEENVISLPAHEKIFTSQMQ